MTPFSHVDTGEPVETPVHSQQPHFFNLPLSLRKKIYHFTLVPGRVFIKPFVPTRYKPGNNAQKKYDAPNLVILRVCKQIYEEAIVEFYRENTFSIVTPDLLLYAIQRYPRLSENIRYIRSVEVIFDICDFRYLTSVFSTQLAMMEQVITRQDNFSAVRPMAKQISALRARLVGAEDHTVGMNLNNIECDERNTGEDDDINHQRYQDKEQARQVRRDEAQLQVQAQIRALSSGYTTNTAFSITHNTEHETDMKMLNDILWGRTLSFIRQYLGLAHISLDFKHCVCAAGCCRLADQVMKWGATKHFRFGLPSYLSISGATEDERGEIVAQMLSAEDNGNKPKEGRQGKDGCGVGVDNRHDTKKELERAAGRVVQLEMAREIEKAMKKQILGLLKGREKKKDRNNNKKALDNASQKTRLDGKK
ncbi:predicted protein [Uncinocarpus reesii 1704]|uniref:DUF7730 domain-containing protein n=1 Tax=Uncinocarpus reesii (strain UAMH 1704) TaxID=336963 RepID=C4JQM0_UNCRE|nr:uncharacterized protein UREG_03365 [Uncinocarpus reesii 1704]EEP78519.1 predicted protein [Uncinocarpus reesii 1704]